MSVQRRRGGFMARYRGPDRVERSQQFATKREAEAWLAAQRVAMDTGQWMAPDLGRVTVADWSAQWLTAQAHLKVSTRTRYASLVRTHIEPTWGRVRLDRVTHSAVVSWVASLTTKGLSPSTVRQAHRVLSLMLALAVRDGRIPRNPAAGVRLPRPRREEPRFLSRAEVDALATAMGAEGDVIRFLALTGLRFGEASALRVGAVDTLRRRVQVVESVAEVAGRLEYGAPKTHQSRSVPLAASLVEPLARRCEGKARDAFVFDAPRGGPLRLRAFRVRFDAAARAAGLEDVSPHDLRHTAASLAVAAGANVKAVQRMLGHQSAAMTLDVYSGLFDDDLDALADRLDGPKIDTIADSVRTGGDVVPLTSRTATR